MITVLTYFVEFTALHFIVVLGGELSNLLLLLVVQAHGSTGENVATLEIEVQSTVCCNVSL